MSEALLTQHIVQKVIGWSRLLRLVRAGWLKPVESNTRRVLFRVKDVHAALKRLEREACPPDRFESIRVTRSKELNGSAYVKKGPRPKAPGLDDLKLDFSAFDL
jgi:hypothetical protein